MLTTLFLAFGVTLVVFLLVIVGMAVGVLAGRREISGSCGGLGQQAGESSCSLCSNPDAACKELKERMQGKSAETCEESSCGEANCSAEGADANLACKD